MGLADLLGGLSAGPFELALVASALLVLLAVLTSKVSDRVGVPALLLFLVLGMLAGSDGPGGIYFDDPALAQAVGTVALVLILFAGGLGTEWGRARPVLGVGITLATAGVIMTALLLAVFVSAALKIPFIDALLLGSIISSTDTPAVFAVMRAKRTGWRGKLGAILELEAGSNDPTAILLTTSVIGVIQSGESPLLSLALSFLLQMALGAAIGYLAGRLLPWLVNRLNLGQDGLYAPLTTALTLLTYAGTALVGGNGFLAVYVAGLVAGNSEFIHRRSLIRFHDGLAWVMQIGMFLVLGLLVFPSRLPAVMGTGLLVTVILMLVVRPLAVFLLTAPSHLKVSEKTMLSWVGLKGAVPIILATYPLLAGLPQAELIFNVVFFVVLVSVVVQGPTIPYLARWLRLTEPMGLQEAAPLEMNEVAGLNTALQEIVLPEGAASVGEKIVDLCLPDDFLVVLIERNREYIVPYGGTVLEAGDRMFVISNKLTLERMGSQLTQCPVGLG